MSGIGGTPSVSIGGSWPGACLVWLHTDGCGLPSLKSTLCGTVLVGTIGETKKTVSPTAISATVSPSATSLKTLSCVSTVAFADRASDPDASAGAPTAATAAHTIHGRYCFLMVQPPEPNEPVIRR